MGNIEITRKLSWLKSVSSIENALMKKLTDV